MPSRRVLVVWLLAALVAIGLASAAVDLATARVTAPVAVSALADATSTPGAASRGTPSPSDPDGDAASAGEPTTDDAEATRPSGRPRDDGAPVAPTDDDTAPAGAAGEPPSATTSTSDDGPDDDGRDEEQGDDGSEPVALDETRTAQAVGGTARFHLGADGIEVLFATPAPGFGVDVDRDGPTDVRVTFEREDHESRIDAELDDGRLRVRVREETDD